MKEHLLNFTLGEGLLNPSGNRCHSSSPLDPTNRLPIYDQTRGSFGFGPSYGELSFNGRPVLGGTSLEANHVPVREGQIRIFQTCQPFRDRSIDTQFIVVDVPFKIDIP